jgi:hypothetical protein
MSLRRNLVFVLVGALPSMGASYRTVNFYVEAPTAQIAQQIGTYAEGYRKQKAVEWLGHEMPAWPEPCPIRVRITRGPAGGATSFAFDRGRVLSQDMNIEGSLDRLLASVLPHEVTHTVFAYYFRMPVPRWADEGGAVLSEDEFEKNEHDMRCRQILNTAGREIPLRRLFALRDYPGDVMALYAEGFSISDYLVNTSGKPAFLAFVAHGMNYGWDNAVQTYYRYNNVDELEQAWLTHLRNTRRQPTFLAQNTPRPAAAEATNRIVTRQTAPPVQPRLASPTAVFRGKAAEGERWDNPSARLTAVRPGYLPDYVPSPASYGPSPRASAPPSVSPPDAGGRYRGGPSDGWHPVIGPPQSISTPVQLGPPQVITQPPPGLGQPVGYPQ